MTLYSRLVERGVAILQGGLGMGGVQGQHACKRSMEGEGRTREGHEGIHIKHRLIFCGPHHKTQLACMLYNARL